MNIEQIDSSTTAGKSEVMRRAAEGATVVTRAIFRPVDSWVRAEKPVWNWADYEYAIMVEPVIPGEVWVVVAPDLETKHVLVMNEQSADYFVTQGQTVAHYVLADHAGGGAAA